MSVFIGFVAGAFVGAIVATFVVALATVSKKSDEDYEQYLEKSEN